MGCSSSTQTLNQGSNKPPMKMVEANGPKKIASEVMNQISDDTDTIPDQTKLMTKNETTANGIPPEEGPADVENANEFEGEETSAPAAEEAREAFLAVDEELSQAEESAEGEIDEAIEASAQEETASEELETKEEETEHPVDGEEPETEDGMVQAVWGLNLLSTVPSHVAKTPNSRLQIST
ncbi:uncharacterized protein PAF06_012644 [Gastrophryne carolinensis]